jgi:hypothetical protein
MSDTDSYLTFAPLSERPGVEVIDRIERRRYRLHTPEAVSPAVADTGSFQFPVGRAVRLETAELVLPRVVGVYARDADGEMVAEVEHLDQASLAEGRYTLELSTQIKTYIEVEGAVDIAADITQTRIDFGEPTTVLLGARSRHRRPATTITTTGDPRDVMRAVEAFGSGLKTTTPERSYPTMRGHPPAVEVGDELDIPATVQAPDTGVRLELPPDLSYVLPAAPLAYYMGADVVPGPVPRLATGDGFAYSLTGPEGFETEVERTLKQVFFLDCVTRTEGYYDIDLHERAAVEPLVDLDFAALYDQPLAAQLEAYLDVPYELVAEHVPEWRLTAHAEPMATSVEQLPYVVDDLAVVRTTEAPSTTTVEAVGITDGGQPEDTRGEVFTRSAGAATRAGDAATRSTGASSSSADSPYVTLESTDTLGQAWIGEGVPIGASKLTTTAFENRFDREQTDGDIAITIVQNDARMDEERDLVDDVYGNREALPFEVDVRRDLTVAQLRETLQERTDFFHYIGHTDEEGLECADGKLDAETLEENGVGAFLLNSCNSYGQGLELIESGAIGGIVTLNDVVNDKAVKMGGLIARLLNAGFPLRATLDIAGEESIVGGQYTVVGDGGMTVAQPASITPNLREIETGEDGFIVEVVTYPTDDAGLGAEFMPFVGGNNEYFLVSGSAGRFQVSEEELTDFLKLEDAPVRLNGELRWSYSLRSELCE